MKEGVLGGWMSPAFRTPLQRRRHRLAGAVAVGLRVRDMMRLSRALLLPELAGVYHFYDRFYGAFSSERHGITLRLR